MKKILALAVAALLAGCGSNDSNSAASGGQCMKDADCKGERICESGACVSPAAVVVPGAQPTINLQDMAHAEPDTPAAPVTPEQAGPAPEWMSGYAQGTSEYIVRHGGVAVIVACPTAYGEDTPRSSITLSRADSSQEEIRSFSFLIKGRSFDGPFEADSNVGEANFKHVYSALREGPFTVLYNGLSVDFPKSNAADVMPDIDSNEFDCQLFW